MKTSQIITEVLKSEPERWFKSWELNQQSTKFGWIGSAGSRRCRELAAKGIILVRHEGKYSEYKTKEVEVIKPTYRKDFIKGLVEKKGRELQTSLF